MCGLVPVTVDGILQVYVDIVNSVVQAIPILEQYLGFWGGVEESE